jgi:hypothetical protein
MKRTFYFLIILFLSCSSKKERIEIKIMECIENIEDEKGIELKSHIQNYEKLLIKKNILKDTSAISYKNLLINYTKQKDILIKINADDSLYIKVYNNRFGDTVFQKIFKCFNSIKNDNKEFDDVKLQKISENILNSKKEEKTSNDVDLAKKLLILNEQDFELQFYKAIVLEFIIRYNSPAL